jgi:hypothetical protein
VPRAADHQAVGREEIPYDEQPDILVVLSVGDITYEVWKNSISRILDLSEKHHCTSLLEDISGQQSKPETVELFRSGEAPPARLRYAAVTPVEISKDHQFLENVGVNRGGFGSRFRKRKEAIARLRAPG